VTHETPTPTVGSLTDMGWGTHVCQFYETHRDLLDTVLPYFRAGLERRQFCLWVLPEPRDVEDATSAVRHAIPDADRHLAARDLEIVDHGIWSFDDGAFDGRRISDGFSAKLADALARGYSGMRVSATPKDAWLAADTWPGFFEFEAGLTAGIADQRMIVLCTYPLEATPGVRVFDVAHAHRAATARRTGRWDVVEVLEVTEARAAVERQNEDLAVRVAERTRELAAANDALRREMAERERTEGALRASEAQLRQAQKMEAIGRLAGGIAHDFNNVLTAIASYSDFIRDASAPDDERRSDAEEIRRAADRAAFLTRQLLAFSRRQILQPRVLDLNAVVRSTEAMLRRTIGEDVTLRTELDPGLGRIRADPGQIEQVLLNLVINARDAMPRGGAVTVATQDVDFDAAEAGARLLPGGGPYVALTVRDTGTGMDAQTRARIFEPFFTTKDPGKGTGLGLSTVYGIATQSGGGIGVDTAVGHGTTFTLWFPRVAADVDERAADPPAATSPTGSETILVVEDDPTVRALIGRGLREYGYDALEAADGAAAVQLCARHPGPIHLLVTDVVMPEVSGRELMEQLAGIRPELRVLLMSGYTDDAIVRHGVVGLDVPFLQKPFTPEELARKIREVLDAPPRATS
jgi:signal transduction histidine kinase/ActR/RegA family two-component response regulator